MHNKNGLGLCLNLPFSETFAFVLPYLHNSESRIPASDAMIPISFGVCALAISISDGTGRLRSRSKYFIFHVELFDSQALKADSQQFLSNIATVIGPTPPGTGVM